MRSDLFMHEAAASGSVFGRESELDVVFAGENAKTDGKTIYLPSLRGDADIDRETAAIMRGYVDHEAGHIRHSDMPLILRKYAEWEKSGRKLLRACHNALEDVWLERKVMAEYPGARANLHAVSDAICKETLKAVETGGIKADDLNDARKVGPVAITWRGRQDYGGSANSALWDKLPEDVKTRIEGIVSQLDECRSTADVMRLAEKAEAIFKSRELLPPPSAGGGEGEGEGKGKGKGKDRGDEGRDKGKPDPKGDSEDEAEAEAEAESESESESEDGAGGSAPLSRFDPKDALERALKRAKAIGGPSKGAYRPASTQSDLVYDVLDPAMSDMWGAQGVRRGIEAIEGGGGRARTYAQLVESMQGQVGDIRRRLERALLAKLQRQWVGGLEEGRFDSKRMTGVIAGRTNVFKRREDTSDLNTAVSLVIDLSGSMRGHRANQAKLAAIAFAEALERTTISYEVVGFSSPCGIGRGAERSKAIRKAVEKYGPTMSRYEALDIPVFKGFDHRLIDRRNVLACLDHAVGGNNVDGESLLMIWSRLRKRPEERKVMIVFSDGSPAAHQEPASEGSLGQHLRDVVAHLVNEGCFVAGIGIETDTVNKYYPVCTSIDNASQLAGEALAMVARGLMSEREVKRLLNKRAA